MEKVYIPFEIFNRLPAEEADGLQEDLMYIYFKENPDRLQDIIDRAEGDSDLVRIYKEEEFKEILSKDYAYDVSILRKRKNDEIAMRLVEEIDRYNLQISQ